MVTIITRCRELQQPSKPLLDCSLSVVFLKKSYSEDTIQLSNENFLRRLLSRLKKTWCLILFQLSASLFWKTWLEADIPAGSWVEAADQSQYFELYPKPSGNQGGPCNTGIMCRYSSYSVTSRLLHFPPNITSEQSSKVTSSECTKVYVKDDKALW